MACPKILTVKLQQVKGAQLRFVVVGPLPKLLKILLNTCDAYSLPVKDNGRDLQPAQSLYDCGTAHAVIRTVLSTKTYLSSLLLREQAQPIEFDFVDPLIAGWWGLNSRRKARSVHGALGKPSLQSSQVLNPVFRCVYRSARCHTQARVLTGFFRHLQL